MFFSLEKLVKKAVFGTKRNLFPIYAHLKYPEVIWRQINRTAIHGWLMHPVQLSVAQQTILTDLNQDGIAVTTLETLFPNQNKLEGLLNYLEKRTDRERTNKKKPFLIDLLPDIPDIGFEVPFFSLAADKTIVDIANAYMGMHVRLFDFNVRKTLISKGKLPFHSQNWHRAPQEIKNCRVYIYLSDVDASSGPFMYIAQSTKGKRNELIAQYSPNQRGYLPAEAVEPHINEKDIRVVTGKAGTVIFCDSTGLHRGGYSEAEQRIMSTFGYSAPSFRENIRYSYAPAVYKTLVNTPSLSKLLHPKWHR